MSTPSPQHDHGKATAESPQVAVVIIGRNEGAHLAACLESVQQMRYPRELLSIVYVDSASRDGSPQTAAGYGVEVLHVQGTPMTAARGRNTGWRATAAPFVLFLDGDVVLHPDFVRTALRHFDDEKTVAVWGHRRESHPEHSVYNRALDLDWIFPVGQSEFFGGDVLIRRVGLEAVGGYDESLIAGEEPEMSRRLAELGWKILHVDAPMTLHDLRMTHFSQYWRRGLRSGHAYAEVSSRYAHTSHPMWRDVAQGNLTRGAAWILAPLAATALSFALRSPVPLLIGAAGAAVMVLRTAWKARSRSRSLATLLLFGVHSHLQQIPAMVGQLWYWSARMRRRRAVLIEYKRA